MCVHQQLILTINGVCLSIVKMAKKQKYCTRVSHMSFDSDDVTASVAG